MRPVVAFLVALAGRLRFQKPLSPQLCWTVVALNTSYLVAPVTWDFGRLSWLLPLRVTLVTSGILIASAIRS